MALPTISEGDLLNKGTSGMPSYPELSVGDLQAKFDELSLDVIVPKFQALVTALENASAGVDLGVTAPTGITASNKVKSVVDAIATMLLALKDAAEEDYDPIVSLLTGITDIVDTVDNLETSIPTCKAIVDFIQYIGGGDMLRTVYDTDSDGIVDNSERLGGELPSHYATQQDLTDELVNINTELAEKANQVDLDVANARMDTFTHLAEGSTTGDAELIDIRIGADGKIDTSAGAGIRRQFSEFKNDLDKLENIHFMNVNMIDNSSTLGSTNSLINYRWFYSEPIPKGSYIKEVSMYFGANHGNGCYELWENNGGTLTKIKEVVFENTIDTHLKTMTTTLDYSANKESYLSWKNDVAYVRLQSVSESDSKILTTTNILDESLDFSNLGVWPFVPQLTLTYTIEKINPNPNVITIGVGGDYADIQSALDGITNDSESNPYTFLLLPSRTPYSRFSMIRKLNESLPWDSKTPRNISIIGLDKKHCVIQSNTGNYQKPPAELLTNGIIKNLTFIMTNDEQDTSATQGGYCCHIDCRTLNDVGYNMVIEDCDFKCESGPCLGIGLHQNANLVIRRCHFETTLLPTYQPYSEYKNLYEYGCIFSHTSVLADAQNQNITFEECVGTCESGVRSLWISSAGSYSPETAKFTYTLLKNVFWNISTNSNGYSISISLTANPMNFGNNN